MKSVNGQGSWHAAAARAAVAMLTCITAQVSDAQGVSDASSYPSRPVRLIVSVNPGGSADFAARLIAGKLNEFLGQRFVVENMGGASGIPATQAVVKAVPDGYTLLLVPSSFGLQQGLYPELPYDQLRDLAPITMVTNAPTILVVNPSLPARSVKELIELAKSRPGEMNFASSGNGGSPHLAGELFKAMAGIEITHVPYKSASQSLLDVVAGRSQLSFASPVSVLGLIKSGKLIPLAVTSARRSASAPDLPTLSEFLPGFEVGGWQGVFTTAGTPRPVIDKLNREIVRAVRSADVLKRIADEGAEPVVNTPEEFGQWLRLEIAKWTKLIKAVGIKLG